MTPSPSPVKHAPPSAVHTKAFTRAACSLLLDVSSAPVRPSQIRTPPSAPPVAKISGAEAAAAAAVEAGLEEPSRGAGRRCGGGRGEGRGCQRGEGRGCQSLEEQGLLEMYAASAGWFRVAATMIAPRSPYHPPLCTRLPALPAIPCHLSLRHCMHIPGIVPYVRDKDGSAWPPTRAHRVDLPRCIVTPQRALSFPNISPLPHYMYTYLKAPCVDVAWMNQRRHQHQRIALSPPRGIETPQLGRSVSRNRQNASAGWIPVELVDGAMVGEERFPELNIGRRKGGVGGGGGWLMEPTRSIIRRGSCTRAPRWNGGGRGVPLAPTNERRAGLGEPIGAINSLLEL
jgi:hypothetical protein